MKSLAGPAMLLFVVGGFTIYKAMSKDDSPSRKFAELELAANDEDHTGTCYSLSTVLIANGVFGNAARTWSAPDAPDGKKNDRKWTLELENVVQGFNGPTREFQKFTFEQVGEQVRLVAVDASKGRSTELDWNIDQLIEAAHARQSTPVDRCLKDGGTGYRYPPKK
jgi:hypothetical protein